MYSNYTLLQICHTAKIGTLNNVYFHHAGFHAIFLPYADDIRTLDVHECPTASAEQVNKMKEIVHKLRFKYRYCFNFFHVNLRGLVYCVHIKTNKPILVVF